MSNYTSEQNIRRRKPITEMNDEELFELVREHRKAMKIKKEARKKDRAERAKTVKLTKESAMLLCKVTGELNCWKWLGHFDKQGYAVLTRTIHMKQFSTARAQRAFYELFIGKIQKGLVTDHLCQNKWCVNPYHLEAVENGENVARIREKATSIFILEYKMRGAAK